MTASAVPILFKRVCPKCLREDRKEGGMFKFVLVAKSRAKEVKWRACPRAIEAGSHQEMMSND